MISYFLFSICLRVSSIIVFASIVRFNLLGKTEEIRWDLSDFRVWLILSFGTWTETDPSRIMKNLSPKVPINIVDTNIFYQIRTLYRWPYDFHIEVKMLSLSSLESWSLLVNLLLVQQSLVRYRRPCPWKIQCSWPIQLSYPSRFHFFIVLLSSRPWWRSISNWFVPFSFFNVWHCWCCCCFSLLYYTVA